MTWRAAADDDNAMDFEYQVEGERWSWAQGLRDLHGLADGLAPTTELILDRMVEEDRSMMQERFARHLRVAGPYSCVYRMKDPYERLHRVLFVGQSEAVAGKVKRLTGFVVDLTEPMRENAREAVEASMEHRAVIEQAKGALMLTFGAEDDVAFDLLRTYSNRHNVKLTAVAEHIVARIADPAFSRADPVRSLLDIVMALEGQDAQASS